MWPEQAARAQASTTGGNAPSGTGNIRQPSQAGTPSSAITQPGAAAPAGGVPGQQTQQTDAPAERAADEAPETSKTDRPPPALQRPRSSPTPPGE